MVELAAKSHPCFQLRLAHVDHIFLMLKVEMSFMIRTAGSFRRIHLWRP